MTSEEKYITAKQYIHMLTLLANEPWRYKRDYDFKVRAVRGVIACILREYDIRTQWFRLYKWWSNDTSKYNQVGHAHFNTASGIDESYPLPEQKLIRELTKLYQYPDLPVDIDIQDAIDTMPNAEILAAMLRVHDSNGNFYDIELTYKNVNEKNPIPEFQIAETALITVQETGENTVTHDSVTTDHDLTTTPTRISSGIPASSSAQHDPVNYPSHYTSHPSGIEAIQITEHMDFLLGNVVKNLWRNGLKDGQTSLEDLEKAQWYLSRKIELIKAERAAQAGNQAGNKEQENR